MLQGRAALFLITNCRTRDNTIHYTFQKIWVINGFVITNIFVLLFWPCIPNISFSLIATEKTPTFSSASSSGWQLRVRYINPSAQRATADQAAVGQARKLGKACVARASCRRCLFSIRNENISKNRKQNSPQITG